MQLIQKKSSSVEFYPDKSFLLVSLVFQSGGVGRGMRRSKESFFKNKSLLKPPTKREIINTLPLTFLRRFRFREKSIDGKFIENFYFAQSIANSNA